MVRPFALRVFASSSSVRMTGLFVVAGAVAAIATPASAELFSIGSTFQIQASGAPTGSFTDTVLLQNGTTLIDGGAISLTVGIVSSPTAEFVTLLYSTVNGSPIGTPGVDWSVAPVGLQAAVPVNFTGNYLEFLSNSVAQTPTGSIFGGFSVTPNPVPGATGSGVGAFGFTDIIPAGPLPALGSYINPWNFLDASGIDSTKVNGFYQALEFASTAPVPEPSTWALSIVGLIGIAWIVRRSPKPQSAA